jgi:hypothetical protein
VSLAEELQERIRGCAEGRAHLTSLRDWLADHVQVIEDSQDDRAEVLADHAWILLAELDYGHRDEQDVRSELGQLLAPSRTLDRHRAAS